jgi:dihydroorotate dehydrogenase
MYKTVARPILFRFEADRIHERTIRWAASASRSKSMLKLAKILYDFQSPALHQNLLGLDFRNPVGLAAGFDKNATMALSLEALGFGFLEIGSITAKPGPGNPFPRSFRLPDDDSLINRMGLNNDGAATVARRLKRLKLSVPLGVNIAKTHDPSITGDAAIQDYCESFGLVKEIADYITLNISCPNTREGKTFEDPEVLERLLRALHVDSDITLPPVFVKLSADVDQTLLNELVDVSCSCSVSGFVAVNTSSLRNGLKTDTEALNRMGAGGLSGRAIREKSTRCIRYLYERLRGDKLIMGVGGVFNSEDAIEKIKAGADLIQVYTGLIYEGPGLIKSINRGIREYLESNSLDHIYQIRKD